jgi:hypothetical protein
MNKQWHQPATWQDFERLCYELLAADSPPNSHHELYGRAGQDQHGLDMLFHPSGRDKPIGVQCKLRNEFAGNVLNESDVVKIYETSRKYEQGLALLKIATTCQRSVPVQDMCTRISQSHQSKYPIQTLFWDDFENLLEKHENVAARFYPEAFSPDRCIRLDEAGNLTVSMTRCQWEERLALFLGHEVFRAGAGAANSWLCTIVAELIDNALDPRKGKATTVRLELGADYLDIFDNGQEFDSTTAPLPNDPQQCGLRAIQEGVAKSGSALVHTYQPADSGKTRFHRNRIEINRKKLPVLDPCRTTASINFIFSGAQARKFVQTLDLEDECDTYVLRLSTEKIAGIAQSASWQLVSALTSKFGARRVIIEVDSTYAHSFTHVAAHFPTLVVRVLS